MKKFGISIVTCSIVLLAFLGFLTATNAGLQVCLRLAKAVAPYALSVKQAQGQLLNQFSLTDIEYRMPQQSIHVQKLSLNWQAWRLLTGKLSIRQFNLHNLELAFLHQPKLKIANMELTGVTGFTAQSPVNLKLAFHKLQLNLNPQVKIERGQGNIAVQGLIANYSLHALLDLPAQGLPTSLWQINGQGQTQAFTLSELQIKTLQGEIKGQGKLDSQTQRWQFSLQANELQPIKQWPMMPENLNLQIVGHGQGQQASINLASLEGLLQGHRLSGMGLLNLTGDTVEELKLSLRAGHAAFKKAGKLAEQWNLSWHLQIPKLAELLAQAKGRLQTTGKLQGPRQNPRLDTQLDLADLSYAQYTAASVKAQGYIDFNSLQPSQFKLQGQGIAIAGSNPAAVELQLTGVNQQQQLTATINMQDEHYLVKATGRQVTNQWYIHLPTLSLLSKRFGNWQLANAAQAVVTAEQAVVQPFCLQAKQQKICLKQASWYKNSRSALSLQASNLELGLLTPWLPAGIMLAGHADLDLSVYASPIQQQVKTDLTIGAAHIQLPKSLAQATIPNFVIHDLSLHSRMDQHKGLNAKLQARLLDQPLLLTVSLPSYTHLGIPDLAQPLQANLSFTLNDLALVTLAAPALTDVKGKLQLELQARGSLARPQFMGKTLLQNAEFTVPAYGTHIENLHGTATSYSDGKLDYEFSAQAGAQGLLHLSGEGWLSNNQFSSRSLLSGEKALVVNTDEYQALANPSVELKTSGTQLMLTGAIEIPQANILPRDFSQGVIELPDDVVILGKGMVNKSSSLPIALQLKLKLGKQVKVDAKGLNGRIEGDVVLYSLPQRAMTATGQLNIVDGSYNAYGETLKIRTGRLIYAGGPIANPGLSIQAARQIKTGLLDNVVVGVNVQGQLKQPKVNLFSEPANLSQADILSYLLTGAPVSQISEAKSQLLLKAASTLKPGGASQIDNLKKGLQQKLGLDELDVGTLQQYSSEKGSIVQNTSLMLGKQLSDKLHLGYSMGITERINTLTLRYQLWRKLLLQTETTGDNSGLDLIYTIER